MFYFLTKNELIFISISLVSWLYSLLFNDKISGKYTKTIANVYNRI